jgi:putative flippase GtrA
VTYARRLYERFAQLIHEVAKFGVVGLIAFIVTEAGTNLLHFQAGIGPLISNAMATVVAACVSFGGNRYWTFRHRDRGGIGREYVIFFVLNAIGLAIQLACLSFTYYVLGLTDKLSYNVALFIGIMFGTLFRFWSYRVWVWRAVPPADAAGVAGLAEAAGPPPAAESAAPARPPWPDLPQANGHFVGGRGTAVPPVGDGTGLAEHDAPR